VLLIAVEREVISIRSIFMMAS